MREEVGVHEDIVGRNQSSIILEEERRGDLWPIMLSLTPDKAYGDLHMTNDFLSASLLLGCLFISLLILLPNTVSIHIARLDNTNKRASR